MINPVNNYYQPEVNTPKPRQVNASGESEKFDLGAGLARESDQDTGKTVADEEEKGVVYEPSSSSGAFHGSADSYQKSADSQNTTSVGESESLPISAILSNVGNILKRIVSSVKEIFSAIWEEKPLPSFSETLEKQMDGAGEKIGNTLDDRTVVDGSSSRELFWENDGLPEEEPLSGGTAMESSVGHSTEASAVDKDKAIRQALKDGDRESFRSLISDKGQKVPARNSSLLTYYDAKGQLVEIDPSERQRILHTDKNVRKL